MVSNQGALLEKTYYDTKNPGSYGGVTRLARATQLPIKVVRDWLMKQDVYTLHKPVRVNFRRRKVIAYGIGELMQCDLIDLSKLSKQNNGIKYVLTAIDVFSKYAYAIPLKSKNAEDMLKAFKKLFKKAKQIVNLQTDRGKEFYNQKVQNYFKKHKIHHYSSHSEYKASVVERFNRTLKSRLYKIFTRNNSYRYVNVLQSVLKSYNQTPHRTIGYAPADVTAKLEAKIFEKVYGYRQPIKYKFGVGDQVRISKARSTFHKAYLANWSDEVFTIHKRFLTNPPTYLLKDLKETIVEGRFYEEELQKVIKTDRDFWRVERILKTKGIGTRKEYFVKWKGFDQRFNSWVKASWMKQ